MGRGRALAALVLTVTLLASCTPQELGELMESQDLRESDTVEEVAAGHVVEAIAVDRTAQELADQAMREKDPQKLEEAAAQRPADPRYSVYLAALALADGDTDLFWNRLTKGSQLYEETRAADGDNRMRSFIGIVLGGLDRALAIEKARTPIEPERVTLLETAFCSFWRGYRVGIDPFESEVRNLLYIGEADCSRP